MKSLIKLTFFLSLFACGQNSQDSTSDLNGYYGDHYPVKDCIWYTYRGVTKCHTAQNGCTPSSVVDNIVPYAYTSYARYRDYYQIKKLHSNRSDWRITFEIDVCLDDNKKPVEYRQ